jgi:hypothetical protein
MQAQPQNQSKYHPVLGWVRGGGARSRAGPPDLRIPQLIFGGGSGIPGDAGEFFFAGFPFGAEQDARADFDQAAREDEDAGGVPGVAVAGAIFAGVEGFGHAAKGNVLDDKFGEVAEGAHFEGVVFKVLAIGGYAQAERNFFRAARGDRGGRLAGDFYFAFPFHGDQGPAGVMHFGEIA